MIPKRGGGGGKGRKFSSPSFPPFLSLSLSFLYFLLPHLLQTSTSLSFSGSSESPSAREAEGDGRRREGEGGSSLVASNEKVMRGIRPPIFHVGEQNKDRLYFLQPRKTKKL